MNDFDFDFDGEVDSNDAARYYSEVESKMQEDWDQYDSFADYFSISQFEDVDFNVDGF